MESHQSRGPVGGLNKFHNAVHQSHFMPMKNGIKSIPFSNGIPALRLDGDHTNYVYSGFNFIGWNYVEAMIHAQQSAAAASECCQQAVINHSQTTIRQYSKHQLLARRTFYKPATRVVEILKQFQLYRSHRGCRGGRGRNRNRNRQSLTTTTTRTTDTTAPPALLSSRQSMEQLSSPPASSTNVNSISTVITRPATTHSFCCIVWGHAVLKTSSWNESQETFVSAYSILQ